MDITHYKIKDMFGGNIVRVSTVEQLQEWLTKSYATLTDGQQEMIRCLGVSFEQGDEDGIKWYGAACDLVIEPKKKTRRKKT